MVRARRVRFALSRACGDALRVRARHRALVISSCATLRPNAQWFATQTRDSASCARFAFQKMARAWCA
eukprot:7536219-Lingulodinium_polyedra.AAC.1